MTYISNMTDLIPVQLVDEYGRELARYVNARAAANGNPKETARISASCMTNATNSDGTAWRWLTTDEARLRRIHELDVELVEEARLMLALADNKFNSFMPKLPDDMEKIVSFAWVWQKNRWWKPRIDALKKTYSRPILMIDASTNEVIKEYPSVRQCCMETGLRKGDISLILSKKRRLKSIKGRTFEYKLKKDRIRRDKELRAWKRGNRKQWKMKN